MKSLYTYLDNKEKETWDGHIHLFNSVKSLPKDTRYEKMVGFMDLEYDRKNLNVRKSYDNYIENELNDNVILLATATNIDDIKSIYEKHNKVIKGFGELKCYDEYRGEKVPYKKIGFVRQVCKFSKEHGCLPVYLHWDLKSKSDIDKLQGVLKTYPEVPLVLCHCGMCEGNQSYAFTQVCLLMQQYKNLWVDISYKAVVFFQSHIMLLNQLDWSRVILGSDINNKIFVNHKDEGERTTYINGIYNSVDILHNYMKGSFSNKENIKKLFRSS